MKMTLISAAALSLAACTQPAAHTPPEVAILKNSLTAAETRIDRLEKQLGNQAIEIAVIKVNQDARNVAVINPGDSNGYTSTHTPLGTLLIATEKVEAHGNGTKLTLYVGNPSTARLGGTELKVRYGAKYESGEYTDWQDSLRSKEITLSEDLYGGSWSRVELALGGVRPEDLSYVELAFDPQEVFLAQRR